MFEPVHVRAGRILKLPFWVIDVAAAAMTATLVRVAF
jgi:hypothetical protein